MAFSLIKPYRLAYKEGSLDNNGQTQVEQDFSPKAVERYHASNLGNPTVLAELDRFREQMMRGPLSADQMT